MAEFCVKCFSALDENGLCPLCGAPTVTPTPAEEVAPEVVPVPAVDSTPVAEPVRRPKFCMNCGTPTDENGLCPLCDAPPAPAEEIVSEEIAPEVIAEEIAPEEIAPEEVIPEEAEVFDIPDIPDVPDQPTWLDQSAYAAPVAQFCMKCGGALDENGVCPVCDAPAAPAAQFCMTCGGALDENGNCPVCNAPAAPAAQFCMTCGGALDENGNCPVCHPMTSLSTAATTASTTASTATATTVIIGAEAPTVAKRRDKTVKNTALTVVFTILLSIFLFITLLASVTVLTARTTVSKGGVATLTQELDVAQLLESTGAANNKQIDEFYYRMERDYNIQLSNDKLTDLVQQSTLPAYISEKTGAFTDAYFEGEAKLVITREEMIDLFYENLPLLEKEIPEDVEYNKLSREDCEVMAKWLLKDEELTIVSSDTLQQSAPAVYQMSTIGLSYVSLVVFLVLSALIAFLMCLNSLSQAALGSGIVCILLGGLTSLAAAVVAWIPNLWASISSTNLVLSIVGAVLTTSSWIFITLLALGVALLITRTICNYIASKRA